MPARRACLSQIARLRSEVGWTALAGFLTASICGCIIFFAPAEYWRDDFQSYFMPNYVDMNRAIQEHSFPLISASSWMGGQIAGDNMSGVFSAVHFSLLLVIFRLGLPLSQTANAIIMVYVAICGAGAFRLGRASGLRRPNALVASFATALNGWMLGWACRTWICFLVSCAWLPWAWWGLLIAQNRRLGRWRFVPAGLFLYLLLVGAHPQTDVMMALVTAWIVLRHVLPPARMRTAWRLVSTGTPVLAGRLLLRRRTLADLWPIGAAWALGMALAAPAILMFVDTFAGSTRAAALSAPDMAWAVPLDAIAGLILPASQAAWRSFGGSVSRDCFELYAGLVPAVAVLAILVHSRFRFLWRHGWEAALLLCSAIFCICGNWGPFRYPFKWLALFHIVMGLLGAYAIQEWFGKEYRSYRRSWRKVGSYLGCWGVLLVLGARELGLHSMLPVLWLEWWPALFYSCPQHLMAMCFCAAMLIQICALWIVLDVITRGLPRLHRWIPAVIMAIAIVTPQKFFTGDATMQWSVGQRVLDSGQLDKQRLYFAFMSSADVYSGDSKNGTVRRFGNAPLYAGREVRQRL